MNWETRNARPATPDTFRAPDHPVAAPLRQLPVRLPGEIESLPSLDKPLGLLVFEWNVSLALRQSRRMPETVPVDPQMRAYTMVQEFIAANLTQQKGPFHMVALDQQGLPNYVTGLTYETAGRAWEDAANQNYVRKETGSKQRYGVLYADGSTVDPPVDYSAVPPKRRTDTFWAT